jgi:hypothetical protein
MGPVHEFVEQQQGADMDPPASQGAESQGDQAAGDGWPEVSWREVEVAIGDPAAGFPIVVTAKVDSLDALRESIKSSVYNAFVESCRPVLATTKPLQDLLAAKEARDNAKRTLKAHERDLLRAQADYSEAKDSRAGDGKVMELAARIGAAQGKIELAQADLATAQQALIEAKKDAEMEARRITAATLTGLNNTNRAREDELQREVRDQVLAALGQLLATYLVAHLAHDATFRGYREGWCELARNALMKPYEWWEGASWLEEND